MSKDHIPDICVIGSGIAGALAAYKLAAQGSQVVILEAGRYVKPAERMSYLREIQFNNLVNNKHTKAWRSDFRERDIFTNSGSVEYQLNSFRTKVVGGCTQHWGGVAVRYTESDFTLRSNWGIGDDWPIKYSDLEPYYGIAEWEIGVSGNDDNPFSSWRSTPFPMPAFPYSFTDKFFMGPCAKLGIKLHTVPYARNTKFRANRPSCQAFGTCSSLRICPIRAQYSGDIHVEKALATNNVTLKSNSSVLHINTDERGNVISVTFADKNGNQHEQKAKVFILAAHAVESARLLLMSTSSHYPNGLANNSGLVGKYFMEHLHTWARGKISEQLYPYRIGFHTAESHQFTNPDNRDDIGGIKISIQSNAGQKPSNLAKNNPGILGSGLSNYIRDNFGHTASVFAQVEQLPDINNYVGLDDKIKDAFGMPAPCINMNIGEYERNTINKGKAVISSILEAVGARDIEYKSEIGFDAHHMGTCRMGNDPEKSVVDANLKAHDVNNLYILGSSTFVTGGVTHPTLTIAALSLRAAEHIAKKNMA